MSLQNDDRFVVQRGSRLFNVPSSALKSEYSSTAQVYVGDNPPDNPVEGDLWWSSIESNLFIWYDDGNSQQWVDASPAFVDLDYDRINAYIEEYVDTNSVSQIINGQDITVSPTNGKGVVTVSFDRSYLNEDQLRQDSLIQDLDDRVTEIEENGGGGTPIPPITFDVTIIGDNKVGDTLTAAVSNLAGGTAPEIKTYVWKSGGIVDGTATTATRVNVNADIGSTITCDITCAEPDGSNPVTKTATYAQAIEISGAIDTPTVLTPPDGAGMNDTPVIPYTSNVVSSTTDTTNTEIIGIGGGALPVVVQTNNNPAHKYIAFGSTGTRPVQWSADGKTWTAAGSITGGYGDNVVTNGTTLVSWYSQGVYSSTDDGQSFTRQQFVNNVFNVGYGNGRFIALAADASNNQTQKPYYSTNGTAWSAGTQFTINDLVNYNSVKWITHCGGDTFLASYFYVDGSSIYRSNLLRTTDGGQNWTLVHTGPDGVRYICCGCSDDGTLLVSAIGGTTPMLYSTDNGSSWTELTNRPGGPNDYCPGPRGIAWNQEQQHWVVALERAVWISETADPNDGWVIARSATNLSLQNVYLLDVGFVNDNSGSLIYSEDKIRWDNSFSDITFANNTVYDVDGNVLPLTFEEAFPVGATVTSTDNGKAGDIVENENNVLTVINLRAPGDQFPTNSPLVSSRQITPYAPGAATLEFTSTPPAGTDINTWGNATWEVDTDANFGAAMTATKALVDGSNQSLLPGERGAITLADGTTYYTRVKYDSTDPAIESAYSDVNEFKTASPPDGWFAVPAPEANQWRSIAYGNNKFVSVSRDGTNQVMYSTDGISWTAVPAAENNLWASVAYGNNKFVAVSNDGTNQVMYSTDGISWTATSAVSDSYWYSVTYGDNKFVAVAQSAAQESVMYSTDGITWTAVSAVSGGSWNSVTYGGNKFVAVGSSGETDSIMYSPDGINWTSVSVPEANFWNSVTYGANKFVAVASTGTNRVMYSPDGINWISASAPEDNSWYGVTYGNNKFVAVSGNGTNRVMYSTDGITWTATSAPEDNSWFGVTYGNNKFVAVGRSGTNRVMYSFTGEGPAARFLAYDETNGKAVNDLNIVARYGVDPEGDNTDLGIYPLTEQPTYEVQGYLKLRNQFRPIRDFTNELSQLRQRVIELESDHETMNNNNGGGSSGY